MRALRTTLRSKDAGVGGAARVAALFVHEAQPGAPSTLGCECSPDELPLAGCVAAGIRDIAVIGPCCAHVVRRGDDAAGAPWLDTSTSAAESGMPFAGTADALYRNRGLIEAFDSDYALVHAGGTARRADYRALLDAHIDIGLGATVMCVEMPLAEAREFGVVGLGKGGRVVRYAHKPAQPQPWQPDATTALAFTGTFAFDRGLLIDLLKVDAADRWSSHDMSRDLLPILIQAGGVSAYVLRHGADSAAPG
jgi:glucose-1-phosphate adenylyltransferase